jgi:bcr-type benzoyl-CoA reductase subunit C
LTAKRTKSKVLQEFTKAADTLVNPEIESWREQGGKVIGYFCSAVPEEIITAAGLMPFRMRATGSEGTELSDAYFSNINCSFPRHCFNMALLGKYDFIEGLICINSCDHLRRVYDNWKRYVKSPFLEIMSLPRKTDELQVGWYCDELANLRKSLEKHFGAKITDEQLKEAIKLHNDTRQLQRKLYNLRKNKNPPITGAETLAVMVASTAMPKKRYNQLLKELLDEISRAEGKTNYRARLMITGGILDNPKFIKVVEDVGGLVVTDSLCFGSRTMWKDIDEREGAPIAALARYYVADRPSCPRMFGEQPRRYKFVRDMIREFRVDGVIGERLIFCDQWLVEHFMQGKDFKEAEIPFLELDREYVLSGTGQLRTRVQAFLEIMGK